MSSYIKATDFAAKDTLPTGDPLKIVSGTEIDDEYNAIQTAVNSKANSASPTLTGTPVTPTATAGTNTTQIASTAFVTTAVDNATSSLGSMSTQNATNVNIDGGAIDGTTIGGSTAAAITGTTITANSGFSGNLTGDVTGNLDGDVTGNLTGDVTGDVTGSATFISGIRAADAASTSLSLTLGTGTWTVMAWFSYYDDNFPSVNLTVGGISVATTANRGDPTGTSFIALSGVRGGVTGSSVSIVANGANTADANLTAFAFRTA